MAWTAPRTWVAGEVVTAALMNTHIRDNLKVLGDPWTAYTPTWKNAAGGSNLLIVDGTLQGAYMQAGKVTAFRILWIRGASSQVGTTYYAFGLPFAAQTFRTGGTADILDASSAVSISHFWNGVNSAEIAITACNGSAVRRIDNNGFGMTPTAWATSDEIRIYGVYEAL